MIYHQKDVMDKVTLESGNECLYEVQSVMSEAETSLLQEQSEKSDSGLTLVNIQVSENAPVSTEEILKKWTDVLTVSSAQDNNDKWAIDLDNLTLVLSEALNEVFQEVLTFTFSLRYEALLGVTVNNDTTFVFSLQGLAGPTSTKLKGWTRRQLESNQVKIRMEDALCRVCWEQAVNVTSLRIEGTTTIIVDNKDVILIQLDQMSYAPEAKIDNTNMIAENETNVNEKPRRRKRRKKDQQMLKNLTENAKDKFENSNKDTEEILEELNGQIDDGVEDEMTKKSRGKRKRNVENVSKTKEELEKEEKTFICEECGKIYHSRSGLKTHKRAKKLVPTLPCNYKECGKLFKDQASLKRHLMTHSGFKNLQCKVCERKFNDSSNLARHMKLHSGIKPHKCDLCDKSFTLAHALREHKLYHGDPQNQCEICFKKFHVKNTLKSHMRMHFKHRREYQKHCCHLCEKTYCNSGGLKRHLSIHRNERNFVCETCNKTFVDKYYLNRHMKLHQDEAPHTCEFCGRTFKWPQYLVRHRRIHTGEMPYKCPGCTKAFKFTSSLSQHKKKCLMM